MATASTSAKLRSMCRLIMRISPSAFGPKTDSWRTDLWRKTIGGPGRPGRSASLPDQIRCSTPRMPSRAASTNSAWTEKSWAGSASPGKELKQFGWIHEIACPSENEIYVAELLNWRVQKLIFTQRNKRLSSAGFSPWRLVLACTKNLQAEAWCYLGFRAPRSGKFNRISCAAFLRCCKEASLIKRSSSWAVILKLQSFA